jgi:RNA polymerase sigma-70 factor (ECF subfamily)
MDTATFLDIYRAHALDVYRFARYLTGSDDAASDIVAETFLRAWAGRSAIRVATAKAYLLAIARNLGRDRRRFARRWPGAEVPEGAVPPDVEARLELDRVLHAVRQLPAAYGEPLMLVANGLSYEEAGRVMNLPVTTVKIRVHRARLMLTQAMTAPPGSPR